MHNDSATYLWHYRLGHIDVKRMKKLHIDRFLESLDTCEPCLMGKMTKTPCSGTMEQANDLLEIIHTDVCGPMSVENSLKPANSAESCHCSPRVSRRLEELA